MLLLLKPPHLHLMSQIFKPSASSKIVDLRGVHKNDTGAHFERISYKKWYVSIFRQSKILEPNAFMKSLKIRQYSKVHICTLL